MNRSLFSSLAAGAVVVCVSLAACGGDATTNAERSSNGEPTSDVQPISRIKAPPSLADCPRSISALARSGFKVRRFLGDRCPATTAINELMSKSYRSRRALLMAVEGRLHLDATQNPRGATVKPRIEHRFRSSVTITFRRISPGVSGGGGGSGRFFGMVGTETPRCAAGRRLWVWRQPNASEGDLVGTTRTERDGSWMLKTRRRIGGIYYASVHLVRHHPLTCEPAHSLTLGVRPH
jgi:hypothetical protein